MRTTRADRPRATADRTTADRTTAGRPGAAIAQRVGPAARGLVLGIFAIILLVPLYLLIINAFKPEQSIVDSPFGIGANDFTFKYLIAAIKSPNFNVIKSYGITALFVVLVDFFSVIIAAPCAYVIARGRTKWHFALLLMFVSGTFIPAQVILIPIVYVLKFLGLIGTIPGFVLFETTLTLPVSIFLYSAYIRGFPRDLDEAASIDGAGRVRAFWSIIFPPMRPVVATMVILNSLGVWNDYATPQIILGPGSGLYTVTTGVYAAVSQYSTNYTVVFPTLLLAILPAMIFFVIMQRYIIGGLISGATKG